MLEAVSSRLLACSSVRCDRSVLPEAISLEAVSMVSVASLISPTSSFEIVHGAVDAVLSVRRKYRVFFGDRLGQVALGQRLATRTMSSTPHHR